MAKVQELFFHPQGTQQLYGRIWEADSPLFFIDDCMSCGRESFMDWGNPSSSDRLTIDLSEHLAKYAVNYCSVSDTEDHLIMMDDNHVACKGVSTKYF